MKGGGGVGGGCVRRLSCAGQLRQGDKGVGRKRRGEAS